MTIVKEDEDRETVECGVPFPSEAFGVTLPQLLLPYAKGHAPWMTDSPTGEVISHWDFDDKSARIGSLFYKKGLRKGDVVIYMTYDFVKVHTFYMGVWRANGIVRALYPEEDQETLYAAVEECRVGWIYCEPEGAAMAKAVASRIYWDVEVIITHGDMDGCTSIEDFFNDDGSELPEYRCNPTDPALILCTSGTTGRSKGAVHSHASLAAMVVASTLLPFYTDKPNLIVSKGTHITGAIFPLAIMLKGASCICMAKLTKENMFDAVHKYKPALIFTFPTFLILLANDPIGENYDLSSLELALTGGAPCSPSMKDSILQLPNLRDVVSLWGLTETAPVTAEINFAAPTPDDYKLRDPPSFSVGKVFPGIELQVRDPDTLEILGPGMKGELVVKGPQLLVNYFNNPGATEEAFVDGFFKTGDLGYFDEEGYIFLVDRIKDIFKFMGNHVSPTELEDVIQRHDAVKEVCVVGVLDPSGLGTLPRAWITLQQGYEHVSPQDIQNFADETLADYKRLRGGVYIIDALPKGKTGKVTRNLVAQLIIPN